MGFLNKKRSARSSGIKYSNIFCLISLLNIDIQPSWFCIIICTNNQTVNDVSVHICENSQLRPALRKQGEYNDLGGDVSHTKHAAVVWCTTAKYINLCIPRQWAQDCNSVCLWFVWKSHAQALLGGMRVARNGNTSQPRPISRMQC